VQLDAVPQVNTVLGQADVTCRDVLDGYVAGAPSTGCLLDVDVKFLVLPRRKTPSFPTLTRTTWV
jgi:hypothetical protein